MKKERTIIIVSTLLVFSGFFLFAGGQQEIAKTQKGNSVTIAVEADWDTLDPHFYLSNPDVHKQIFESLVGWEQGPNGQFGPVPELATSWELKGKEAIFHLREGVLFHDGSEFNAEVAAWNLERAMSEKSQRKDVLGFIENVEALNDFTLKVNLQYPTAIVLINLSRAIMRPIHMVSKVAVDKYGEDFGRNPVGTGPFVLKTWKSGDHIVLQKNENYWNPGEPKLDTLTFRFIPEAAVNVLELQAGSVDLIFNLSAYDIPQLDAREDIILQDVPWTGRIHGYGWNAQQEPGGTNKKLRQAAAYAIDRNAIANTLAPYGTGEFGKYFIGEGVVGYDKSLPYYDYNPEKAKQLLAEAGYADGIDVTLSVIARDLDKKQAEMIKEMWDAVGIRTELEILERMAFVQKTRAAQHQVATFLTTIDPDADVEIGTRFGSDGSGNSACWQDPYMDKLLEEARAAYDFDERHELYMEIQKYAFDQAIYVPLINTKKVIAYNKKLQNMKYDFAGVVFWEDVTLAE